MQIEINLKPLLLILLLKDNVVKIFIFLMLFTFKENQLIAQTDSTQTILKLEEIVVSGIKFEQLKKESPNQFEIITRTEIANKNAANTANLLEQTGKIFVQRSQAGGGSPVLRGFEANKVLIVIDGVRLNNAIYRSGHLQNILRIDQGIVNRAEVIFGPSSVIYGSDALGGVINLKTRDPEFNKISSNVFLRHASAYNEKTFHFDLNLGYKNIGFLSSFSISDFGDLIMGKKFNAKYPDFGTRTNYISRTFNGDTILPNKNKYSQSPSSYKQIDLLQKIIFITGKLTHIFNSQISVSSIVPRYDRLTELDKNKTLKFAEWNYGPELRTLGSYNLVIPKNKFFDKGIIIGAAQLISESRVSRKLNDDYRKTQDELVTVYSLNADFQKNINSNTLQFGAEITKNNVNSSAIYFNLKNSSESKLADTRYPDGGSKTQSFSLYISTVIQVKIHLDL
jgi:hemoglobin/transferrin/lactoferrin receptor protein